MERIFIFLKHTLCVRVCPLGHMLPHAVTLWNGSVSLVTSVLGSSQNNTVMLSGADELHERVLRISSEPGPQVWGW